MHRKCGGRSMAFGRFDGAQELVWLARALCHEFAGTIAPRQFCYCYYWIFMAAIYLQV